jgi:hypothetical protein
LRLGLKSLEKNLLNKQKNVKANALFCPICCVEYIAVEFDFEIEGVVLHNVKALRCPSCDEEVFTPEQLDMIRKQAIQ